MIAESLIAFAGGALTLVSPCSALLLPAFFAYAFGGAGRLLARTGIFLAGLLTVLVPLGLGAGALGSLVLTRRAEVTAVAGLLLVAIGLYQLAVGGFSIPASGRLEQARAGLSSDSVLSTYLLGGVYALGGFCAGPILGGVLTIAAASGGPLPGAILLAIYGAGMAVPVFLLALVWTRVERRVHDAIVRRELRVGDISRPLGTVVSSLLFIGLGLLFIITQGANALAPLYAAVDVDGFLLDAESAIRSAVMSIPDAAIVAFVMVALGLATWWRLGRKGARAR
ncbi:MAG: cytochrome c biogenesis CcdA family protein [Chloroflexota bacterium]